MMRDVGKKANYIRSKTDLTCSQSFGVICNNKNIECKCNHKYSYNYKKDKLDIKEQKSKNDHSKNTDIDAGKNNHDNDDDELKLSKLVLPNMTQEFGNVNISSMITVYQYRF